MNRFRTIVTLLAASLVPLVASAQAPDSFQSLAKTITTLLNAGAILIITATIVVYFYGVVGNIYKARTGEASKDMRSALIWGVIIIFFMVSIWGIVQVIQFSLFGGPSPSATNGVVIYNQ